MPKRAKKILLVDDDRDLVEATKAILKSKSYKVVTAYDGEEGLRKVVEERPDLIILDVIMPVKDGLSVCKELKTDPKYFFFSKIPILMMTVYPGDRSKAKLSMLEGMALEAEDYIQKPVSPEELLRRAERLLSRKQA